MGKLNPHIRLKCFPARVRCATSTGEEEQAIDHCVTGQDGAAELVLSWSVPSLRKPSCISQMSFIMKDKVCIHLQVRSIRRFTSLASESQWSDSSSPAGSVLAPAMDLPNIKQNAQQSTLLVSLIITYSPGVWHLLSPTEPWKVRHWNVTKRSCCLRVCVLEKCLVHLKPPLEK